MIKVFIEGLEVYAYHGASESEQAVGHRYRLDVEYELETCALESDRLEDTVDYAKVAEALQEGMTTAKFLTVERLAQRLVEDLLAAFPKIDAVRLRVAKRLPPAPMIADAVGVEIERRRV